jgi:antirestriction protein ArdC
MTTGEIYKIVTDQIIEALERVDPKDFKLPWHKKESFGMPKNTISGKHYRGINTVVLWIMSEKKGYSSSDWGTFKQWQEKGASVKKGEKSTRVVFWKPITKGEKGDDNFSSFMIAKQYCVFNKAQVDGLEEDQEVGETPKLSEEERNLRAEGFVEETGAIIDHSSNKAFYESATDKIKMPKFEAFFSGVGYYSTLFHELTHWTSHKDRCDRKLTFDRDKYAFEELVAELGSAFLCSKLEVTNEPREDHAQYIKGWLAALKSDPKAIFKAASAAQKAVDFLEGVKSENL